MTAGVFSQNELCSRSANGFRSHDFVAEWIREHAMLVNAGGVRKRIFANHRLVWLWPETDHSRQLPTGRVKQFCFDAGLVLQTIAANSHHHRDFFESCIACALADAVDRALHLACASVNASQSIGHRESQVVVAVHRDYRLIDVAHFLAEVRDEGAVLCRQRVPDRIGNVQRRSSSLDRGLQNLAKKVKV